MMPPERSQRGERAADATLSWGQTLSGFPVVSPGHDSYTSRMKIRNLLRTGVILGALALCGFSRAVFAGEVTALSLIKPADEYVGKGVAGQVTGIRSEKSVAGLQPNIWYVVYYDKDATFKTAEVKFGVGKELEVKHPLRQPFAYINDKNLLDQKAIKIDSDKAIKIATAEKTLDGLTIRATQLWLSHADNVNTWRVKLWAQKLRHPNDDADIGDVFISADDGKVIKTDLHIEHVD